MRKKLFNIIFNRQWVFIFPIFLTFFSHSGVAASRYPLSTPAEQQQFDRLTQGFRCLVCQNESIADSEAPLAQDLRNQVYTMVKQGQSDQAIQNYMVSRYGNFVLFKPPVMGSTYLLWGLPFLFIAIGVLVLHRLVKGTK